ncbi:hypothetical protein [Microbacterium sp.]|uniref:hypothetical protein n=1 Tax=Microbacterium sp. TaxID=51671 RepID=UPI003A88C262
MSEELGVETIESLVEKLRLTEVVYYGVGAKLRADDAPFESPEGEYSTDFGFRTRHIGIEFGARLTVEVHAEQGDVTVDIACEYVSDAPLRIPREVAYEFVNNVTLMQAFPYVREAVMTLTSRVFRSPLLLPVLLRGALSFSSDGDGPDVSDGAAALAAQEAAEDGVS